MFGQIENAQAFHALHIKGDPVVLFNIWDAGSAKAVAEAGSKAIASGSAPVAMANGYPDGQALDLENALDIIRRVIAAVDLPVTMDFEGAYSDDPAQGALNFTRVLETGAVGINFEDQIIGGSGLYDVADQVVRIMALRGAADTFGVSAFLNARTDVFLKAYAKKAEPTCEMLDEVITRAKAYADAGADGFFAPGLVDISLIQELCEACPLPVNIIALPGAPTRSELAQAGVARISYGPVPYKQMTHWLTEQARAALNA